MQPGFRAVLTPLPCGPRPGRPSPVCQVGNGYDKTRLYSPIRSKTTTVRSEDAQVLRAEVMNLLVKGAIEIVPPAQSESGFYSRYFLISKKDSGMRPILDL